jgi:ATP-dependent DNA helicase RecG
MPPFAFGRAEPLARGDLLVAPVRYPHPSRLEQSLEVKPARAAKAVESLGIDTRADLLEHLPFRHEDRREARDVGSLAVGEEASVVVTVKRIARRPTRRRRLTIVEATVADDTGPMKAVFFNQPWLVDRLPEGTVAVLHGRYQGGKKGFVVSEYEIARGPSAGDLHSTGLVPVYPATEGVDSKKLRELAFGIRGLVHDAIDPLPGRLRAAECLPDRPAALAAVHFPEREGDDTAARERLAFDELLGLEMGLLARRQARRSAGAPALGEPGQLTERWLREGLPFELTGDQRKAIEALDRDLAEARPAQRLLMGEVGSGKTVVALYAMLRAVENGMQAALMAPTETLAEQHFATLERLSAGELVPIAILTGSTPAARRAEVLAKLASGELSLVVGTHALVEDPVEFDRLGVVVVDEQHRFGVSQRRALDKKGGELAPHGIHMTATPIPRTLALSLYGDLDVTLLRELPAGRRPVETFLATGARERARAYERIREELRAGHQAFVVCPLVEESEALQARAATKEFERLRDTELRDFRVVLMHGQLKHREKQAAMAAFAEGEADVLVATSVIEVGIDVPNATVMLVEDAERYGISQLHQLRGRVGRGEHDSVCLLFGSKEAPRLRALAETNDGFELAEVDLKIRGEGELLGMRQSGVQEFRAARLPDDAELLERARLAARSMLEQDPELTEPEHALLAVTLGDRESGALEPIPA